MSLDPSITTEHCLAVHDAIQAQRITEKKPINDELMAPFISAAKQYMADGKEKVDASRMVKYTVYSTLRDAYREEAGEDLDKRQEAHLKSQKVEDAVVAGLKERGFNLQ